MAGSSDEARLLSLLQGERETRGLPEYRPDPALRDAARRHSEEMAAAARSFHSRDPYGDNPGFARLGENVGSYSRLGPIHVAFMRSPSHRSNILSTRFDRVGVGVVRKDGRYFVTQLFGVRRSSPSARPSGETQPDPPTATAPTRRAASRSITMLLRLLELR